MDDRAEATFSHDCRSFLLFLDHAMRRALVAPNVGARFKTTCTQVLPVALGPQWEAVDILALDVDDVLAKFQVEAPRHLPPAAVNKRRTDLTESLGLFRTFIGQPSLETMPIASPSPMVAPHPTEPDRTAPQFPVPDRAPRPRSLPKAVRAMPTQPQSATTRPPGKTRTLTYPFPLRVGVVVRISLPADLTTRESRRLARFLDTLTVDGDHVVTRAVDGHPSSSPRAASAAQAGP